MREITREEIGQVYPVRGPRGTGGADGRGSGITTDERGIFDDGRFRAAWIKDPDGNTIALTESRH